MIAQPGAICKPNLHNFPENPAHIAQSVQNPIVSGPQVWYNQGVDRI